MGTKDHNSVKATKAETNPESIGDWYPTGDCSNTHLAADPQTNKGLILDECMVSLLLALIVSFF